MTTPARYIISYDIREPRRLLRVMRRVRKSAVPLQYSVYFAELTLAQRDCLLRDLAVLIDDRVDDVRIYATGPLEQAICLGAMQLPVGPLLLLD